MRKLARILIIIAVAAAMLAAGYVLWDNVTQVPATELEQIVQRDGVPFDEQSFPEEVIDRLADNRVVVLGELHFLREHRELVAGLLRELHARGFRQYLFEWTQAADWLLADFVNDGGLMPDWTPPHDIGGDALTAVRDFNRTLPEDERIRVHAIDVHLADYGGADSWVAILGLVAQQLPDPGPISAFLRGVHDTYDSHHAELEVLRTRLETGRSELTATWGEYWYATVLEMVEVELKAAAIRAIRDSDYEESVRQREEAIKWLADRRINSTPHGTLINIGATHAQKEQLFGTEVEWLGDYLVHESQATNGSVVVLNVAAAQIVPVADSSFTGFELAASPDNELLRVMNETWPDQIVFLPLDDPVFGSGRVPINASGEIFVGAPQRHFDVFVLLPLAHRDFVGD